jgi:eukaryotic-like serine/threonine-protein kinase
VEPEPSWNWPPGHQLVPGLLAWALLGDGRRCETWLAWDLGRWCPVAVKLPRPAPASRSARPHRPSRVVAALVAEAEAATAIAHPGVRRLLEARIDQPLPHLVFEYVEGPTLDDALAEDGPFHPTDVLLLGMQLAAALGHLHGRGLVHLDVKPGNAVLRDGRPVLIDLGLVQPVGQPPAGGHRRGSPPWMAPEQVRRQPASPGMDLFALGAVLFELATGSQAFEPVDHGPPQRRWPQLAGPPPRPSSRNPEVPAAVDQALAALLAPDPADRPATAAQVLALLAAAVPAEAPDEDRLWPSWAARHLVGRAASAMERPPLVPGPA